jgi:hypothetical protein
MFFRVGPYRYRVRISEGQLRDENGDDCAGLWEWETRTVWLSSTLSVSHRHETLLHELSHAWQRHFGTISSAEDEANRTAAFAIDVQRQLSAQGGDLALMRLGSDGIIDNGAVVAVTSQVGAQCGVCSTSFSPSQVVSETAEQLEGRAVVRRSCWCDFCGHVIRWVETATSQGFPAGAVVSGPEYLRGPAADQWLRRHGVEAGVCGASD